MPRRLVGPSLLAFWLVAAQAEAVLPKPLVDQREPTTDAPLSSACLLYTSDAADEL